ncbi:hypothetical protein RN001_014287 [Aquatica leii]|uniref:Uncharacterized protein n=1 Tax=Aquatica leii TaxID=1421715 RepID=A0AAN7PSS4_9COLE|nr:hypothetical protein RN001_014287 [Aquatica leii]
MVEKKPQVDVAQLVQKLVPTLVNVLKDVFISKTTTTPPPNTRASFSSSSHAISSGVTVELQLATADKRKQSDLTPSPLDEGSDASETSNKTKKGWPRGKPRKQTNPTFLPLFSVILKNGNSRYTGSRIKAERCDSNCNSYGTKVHTKPTTRPVEIRPTSWCNRRNGTRG